MLKKISYLLLVSIIIVAMLPISVFAADTSEVGASNNTYKPGDKIVTTISVSSENGVSGYSTKLVFDSSILEIVADESGLVDKTNWAELGTLPNIDVIFKTEGAAAPTEVEELYKVTFKVKETTKATTATVQRTETIIATGDDTDSIRLDDKTFTYTIDQSGNVDSGWTDFSKAKFVVPEVIDYIPLEQIEVQNIKYNKDHSYRVYVLKDKNAKLEDLEAMKDYANLITNSKTEKVVVSLGETLARTHLEMPGDSYIYIVEKDGTESKLVVNGVKLDVPPLPTYGSRFDVYLYDAAKTSISNCLGASKDRTVTYKIGKVESNDVLRTFKNNGAVAGFKALAQYVKTAKILKTGTFKLSEDVLSANLISDVDIDDDAYYFVAFTVGSENGKYVEFDDVQIYDAIVESGKKEMVHFEYGTMNVPDDTISTDGKLPQTGEAPIVALGIAIVAANVVAAVAFLRKKSNLK
jgi:hypothetical protein